jgi:hypothetical protein
MATAGLRARSRTCRWPGRKGDSPDTALRDIQQLVERGVLVRNSAGGRSTSYSLA